MKEKDKEEVRQAHELLRRFLQLRPDPVYLEIASLKLERVMLRNTIAPVHPDKESA